MNEDIKHIHWVVIGYTSFSEVTKAYEETVEIHVVANSAEQAIKKSKKLISKPFYIVRSVTDECPVEDYYRDIGLEIQKRSYKLMKKLTS